ncbi:MAG: YncE family protein [Acidobacteria bacterium]|nr:MAG: YncE family protein [Acidobacteriota bacterium]
MVLLGGVAGAAAPAAPGYHLLKTFAVGGDGGWDYLTLDAAAHRLYLSRSTHVVVIDAATGAPVGEIADTPGVHGVVLVPGTEIGYTSDGRSGNATMFDTRTFKAIKRVAVGEGPDAIVYDPASKRVFTMNGHGHDTTAIEAATGAVAGRVALGGKPEFAAADGRGHLFVNIEDTSEVVELDTAKLVVLARWPLAPGEGPSGMAIDAAHHRLFIGCHNKLMAVLNTDTGKVIATLPIGAGVDANAFDPATGLAFASCGDGSLTVARESSPDQFAVAETVTTQRGARTMALDPATGTVYLATATFGPPPPPTPERPHPWPSIVPGSFVVLVFGR